MQLHEIHIWGLYLCKLCYHATPPKDKYVIVVYKEAQHALGFFVNSRIHPFIQAKPDLFACQGKILAEGHKLHHDSSIDCQKIYPFSPTDLSSFRGHITAEAKANILQTVEVCTVLEQKHKKAILANG